MSFLEASKANTETGFVITEPTYTYVLDLEYYTEKCAGCGMCVTVCPKDAIKLADQKTLLQKPAGINLIDIDVMKCVTCGVCAATCIFNALKLKHRDNLNQTEDYKILIVEKRGYPSFQVTAVVDLEKCNFCKLCEKVCPRDAITVTSKERVDIDSQLCIGCGWCEWVCPTNAIVNNKPLTGKIEVNSEACASDCEACVTVCPSDALYLERIAESRFDKVKRNLIEKKILKQKPNGIVVLNEFCILCGACKQVSSVENCIHIERKLASTPRLRARKLWNGVKKKLHKATIEVEGSQEPTSKDMGL